MHEVLGPPLSYPTPLKHSGRGASHSGLFVRGCCVALHEDSCISTRSHSGRIGRNTALSSCSDVIPMGSKRFALQTGHRARVSLVRGPWLEGSLWQASSRPGALQGQPGGRTNEAHWRANERPGPGRFARRLRQRPAASLARGFRPGETCWVDISPCPPLAH
jgi:hypothetical protein